MFTLYWPTDVLHFLKRREERLVSAADQVRLYFVMELIQGEPITPYCDQKKLTINQRLERV